MSSTVNCQPIKPQHTVFLAQRGHPRIQEDPKLDGGSKQNLSGLNRLQSIYKQWQVDWRVTVSAMASFDLDTRPHDGHVRQAGLPRPSD